MSSQIPTLDGEIARRPLHFFWLVDCSGSMSGKKIATLNQAIRESIPQIQKVANTHPQVQIMMRSIKFSSSASWHIGPDAVSIENFTWSDLSADGGTATDEAIRILTGELALEKMPKRGFPPVCILLSDGYCTSSESAYDKSINDLIALPWGKKSVRLVIAIGNEGDYDEQALLKFVSHKEVGVLKADSPEKLIAYIKWASETGTLSASSGKSKGGVITEDSNVELGTPPDIQITSSTDVF